VLLDHVLPVETTAIRVDRLVLLDHVLPVHITYLLMKLLHIWLNDLYCTVCLIFRMMFLFIVR